MDFYRLLLAVVVEFNKYGLRYPHRLIGFQLAVYWIGYSLYTHTCAWAQCSGIMLTCMDCKNLSKPLFNQSPCNENDIVISKNQVVEWNSKYVCPSCSSASEKCNEVTLAGKYLKHNSVNSEHLKRLFIYRLFLNLTTFFYP